MDSETEKSCDLLGVLLKVSVTSDVSDSEMLPVFCCENDGVSLRVTVRVVLKEVVGVSVFVPVSVCISVRVSVCVTDSETVADVEAVMKDDFEKVTVGDTVMEKDSDCEFDLVNEFAGEGVEESDAVGDPSVWLYVSVRDGVGEVLSVASSVSVPLGVVDLVLDPTDLERVSDRCCDSESVSVNVGVTLSVKFRENDSVNVAVVDSDVESETACENDGVFDSVRGAVSVFPVMLVEKVIESVTVNDLDTSVEVDGENDSD